MKKQTKLCISNNKTQALSKPDMFKKDLQANRYVILVCENKYFKIKTYQKTGTK